MDDSRHKIHIYIRAVPKYESKDLAMQEFGLHKKILQRPKSISNGAFKGQLEKSKSVYIMDCEKKHTFFNINMLQRRSNAPAELPRIKMLHRFKRTSLQLNQSSVYDAMKKSFNSQLINQLNFKSAKMKINDASSRIEHCSFKQFNLDYDDTRGRKTIKKISHTILRAKNIAKSHRCAISQKISDLKHTLNKEQHNLNPNITKITKKPSFLSPNYMSSSLDPRTKRKQKLYRFLNQ
jgi:hypothetical protein